VIVRRRCKRKIGKIWKRNVEMQHKDAKMWERCERRCKREM
jgi:hypothetical protein